MMKKGLNLHLQKVKSIVPKKEKNVNSMGTKKPVHRGDQSVSMCK